MAERQPVHYVQGRIAQGRKRTGPDRYAVTRKQKQINWEGIPDLVNNININTNVLVGIGSSGILQIVQVEVRNMNMVIGDSKQLGPNQTLYGNGTVYITGMGSLFNNDPYLVPNYLPSNFRSKVPRIGRG